ncbi:MULTISPECIES: hypothetical protein [unclassified Moritella]|nr:MULTISPECIES: hypothetical protein [unclassified Moritella]
MDGYSRAVRRISAYFDKSPDTLTTADLKVYFNSLPGPLLGVPLN